MTHKVLRLILGDQLNINHPWYAQVDTAVTYYMSEVRSETDYVVHHIQKIAAFFLSMRNFCNALRAKGHRVLYFTLDKTPYGTDLIEGLQTIIKEEGFTHFEYQEPDEYRLHTKLAMFCSTLPFTSNCVSTAHFLTDKDEAALFFKGKKSWLMENFYRYMRKKHNLLMQPDGKPEGGVWNFDAENRQPYTGNVKVPDIPHFEQNLHDIYAYIESQGIKTMGRKRSNILFPTTRAQSLTLLDHFLAYRLPYFGTYEDAMYAEEPILFHSLLSFALNVKWISPLEVVQAAIATYKKKTNIISISQIEGFVRQIIGWREYTRGVYWAYMPRFSHLNFFNHTRKMPEWYWTGNTKMNCMSQVISQSLDSAYAHHIQRLMVVGNFSLLAGIHPDEVDNWYLGVYADAIEWVQIINTRGMSQYADGGIVGSKPYVASANYMHKMSNYCSKCYYNRQAKTGEKACPFNSLYWDFFDRNKEKLGENLRLKLTYQAWSKFPYELKQDILNHAALVKNNINSL